MTGETQHNIGQLRALVAANGCDIAAFMQAVEIAHDDIVGLRAQLSQIDVEDIDFNGDNEVHGSTWEWGAALVAAAHLARQGASLSEVPREALIAEARTIYQRRREEMTPQCKSR